MIPFLLRKHKFDGSCLCYLCLVCILYKCCFLSMLSSSVLLYSLDYIELGPGQNGMLKLENQVVFEIFTVLSWFNDGGGGTGFL